MGSTIQAEVKLPTIGITSGVAESIISDFVRRTREPPREAWRGVPPSFECVFKIRLEMFQVVIFVHDDDLGSVCFTEKVRWGLTIPEDLCPSQKN